MSDLARSWAECGAVADIIVLQDRNNEHTLNPDSVPGVRVHRISALPWSERYAYVAGVAALVLLNPAISPVVPHFFVNG